MSEKRKPGTFPPGKSGNPSGRPKIPSDVLSGRRMNTIIVARLLNKFMNMSIEDLQVQMRDPKSPALELMIGKIVAEAIKHGDYSRVNFLFDRMIGKVTEKVEHKLPKPTVIKLIGEDAAIVLGNSTEDEEEDEI